MPDVSRADRSPPERANELAGLHEFTEQLSLARSLNQIYSAGLGAVRGALDCPRAAILLFDGSGVMRFVAWRGMSDVELPVKSAPPSHRTGNSLMSDPVDRTASRLVGRDWLAMSQRGDFAAPNLKHRESPH